jgi:phospholipid/cholesterol/gamma-HCH transport system substrate-binding protein
VAESTRTRTPGERRARAFRATMIKLGSFVVVMLLVFTALVVVFSKYRSGSTNEYTAVFTSASALKSGSSVEIAGVEVGSVSEVSLDRDNQAVIRFTVGDTYRVPASVQALIRYKNLTGDRYLELRREPGETGRALADGARIPVQQTQPALDLDNLVGGFKPLLRTLDPKEADKLTASLIQVFQGQGPALNHLLENTAQFTDSLADRDQLIGDVIDNLNTMIGTVEDDKKGFDTSVDLLQQLVTGLSSQREVIGDALTQTSRLTNGMADLLSTTRPDLQKVVHNTGRVSEEVLKAEPYLRDVLTRLPEDYKKLSNLGSYGAWLQIYFCRIRLLIGGPGDTQIYFTAIDMLGDRTQAHGRCALR